MSLDPETSRLLQAIEHFENRSKGADLPKGVSEAIQGLSSALGRSQPSRDTPGKRETLKVAPGTDGTGEHFSKAAVGQDGPSPGQREARSLSQEIQAAAESIAAKA